MVDVVFETEADGEVGVGVATAPQTPVVVLASSLWRSIPPQLEHRRQGQIRLLLRLIVLLSLVLLLLLHLLLLLLLLEMEGERRLEGDGTVDRVSTFSFGHLRRGVEWRQKAV